MSDGEKSSVRPAVKVGSMLESIVGCKWSLSVLDAITQGIHRPSELQRACDGISTKVLNERLRKLAQFGIIERVVYPEVPPRVEYRLTDFGRRFIPIVTAIRDLEAEIEADVESTESSSPTEASSS